MHWLDSEQAPTNLCVGRSKISIARLVPVMVVLAVAVRTALCPGSTNASEAARSRRCTVSPGRSVETGTLGVTTGDTTDPIRVDVFPDKAEAGSRMSVHAAGLLNPGFTPVGAHGDWPSGGDPTPGGASATPPMLVHAAPSPEAGHCWAPAGTATRASSF